MNQIDIRDRLNELEYKCIALADMFSGLPKTGLCKDTPHGLFLLMRGMAAELRQLSDEVKAANEA
jgi:hypothetical protein